MENITVKKPKKGRSEINNHDFLVNNQNVSPEINIVFPRNNQPDINYFDENFNDNNEILEEKKKKTNSTGVSSLHNDMFFQNLPEGLISDDLNFQSEAEFTYNEIGLKIDDNNTTKSNKQISLDLLRKEKELLLNKERGKFQKKSLKETLICLSKISEVYGNVLKLDNFKRKLKLLKN